MSRGQDHHEKASAQSPTGTPDLAFTKLGDLLNEPEERVDWLVDDLLPESGFSLLVAKPKVGKTTLARFLALCVAQGTPFLGRTVMQGPVIYLALEEKRSEVRRHFRDMGATGDEDIYVYAAAAPADGFEKVRKATERLKPALVIIDPLFKMTRVKDGNDYAQMTQALEPILVMARETHAHVLCVHHAGKGMREGADSILGSTAIFGAVDTAIIMHRTKEYRTIQSQQRYGTDLEETVLHFDPTTRTLGLGESKAREDMTSVKVAILECLQTQEHDQEEGHALTEGEVNHAVEGRNAHKRTALRELARDGQIVRLGKGGKGDPYRYAIQDSRFACTLVPVYIPGTTVQESDNGISPSNDVEHACPQNCEHPKKVGDKHFSSGTSIPGDAPEASLDNDTGLWEVLR
jgi:hypothetical protein